MSHDAIPTKEQWGDVTSDFDVASAFQDFFGKTIEEVLPLVREHPVEAAEDLRFAPPGIFAFYVAAFVQALSPPRGQGRSDVASCFLNLVQNWAERDPMLVAGVWPSIGDSVIHVSTNQGYYGADPAIYGDFQAKLAGIQRLLSQKA